MGCRKYSKPDCCWRRTEFTATMVSDGDKVVISRVESGTKIGASDALTVRVAYVKRPKDVMEVMWFAPTGGWGELQETFAKVMSSIEMDQVRRDFRAVNDAPARLAGACQPAPGQGLVVPLTRQEDGPTGVEFSYVVSYAANRDRVLEIVGYAPSEQWEYGQHIVNTMLSVMGDTRPR